jgi:ribosomal protein S18 acetylase RimI-like enzyme
MAQDQDGQPTIRRAGPGDAALLRTLNREVQALHAAAWPRRFKAVVDDDGPFAAMLAEPETRVFIAAVRGEPAGYCSITVQRRPENAFTNASATVYIDQIAVLSAYRQHGVGAALIKQAKALARELAADRVALDVWKFNDTAQRFFAGQGFSTYNERMQLEIGG